MLRDLRLATAAGLATLLGQLLAFSLWVRPVGTTALWFPGAVALAFMANHERRRWPVIMLGFLAGGALAFQLRDGSATDALVGYAGLAVLLVLAALPLRLPTQRGELIAQMPDLLRFYLYGVLAFPLAGTAWAMFIILSIKNQLEHFVALWFLSIPCFAAAVVLVAPFLSGLPAFLRSDDDRRRELLGKGLSAGVLNMVIAGLLWTVLPDTINRLPALVFGIIPLLVLCAFKLPRFGLSLAFLVSLAPALVVAILMDLPNRDDIRLVNTQILQWSIIAIGFLVHALAIVAGSHRAAEERLAKAAALAINRQEQERANVSRELHDSIGQRIALAAFTLGNLSGTDRAGLPGSLEGVRTDLMSLLDEVRNISRNLHPSAVAHAGLPASLEALGAEISRHWDGQVRLEIEPIRTPLVDEVALNLFRVTQEAVRNALEHGRPRTLWIRLGERAGGTAFLEVEDDGAGFEAHDEDRIGDGLGLLSMRERCRQIGADLDILSGNGRKGTCVCVKIPAME